MPDKRVEPSASFRDTADYIREKQIPRWARDPFQQVSSRALPSWASSMLWFILPSFVSSYVRPNPTARTKPMHDTAYLDGLRGVAAFIVYLHHTQLMYRFDDSLHGYGSTPLANHILQLPFFRLLVAGQASVALFFVISGYVLSFKTLGHIHENQGEKVLSTLSSSVLRRSVRLYLPFAAITLFLAINAQTNFPLTIPYGDYRRGSFQEQMEHWWKVVAMTVNPLHSTDPPYAPTAFLGVAWTLPLEFNGSMIVFMLLLALARTKRWVHALVVLVIGVYWPLSIGSSSSYTALFCAGMLLAELAIVFPPATSSSNHRVSFFRGNSRSFRHNHQLVTILLFIVALYLLSAPQRGLKTSVGFITISKYIPASYDDDPGKFLIVLGSILMTLVIMYAPTRAPTQNDALPREGYGVLELQQHYDVANAPLLQRVFTSRVSQYLGRISFSLYLWHEPIKVVVGSRYARGTQALLAAYGPMAVTMNADSIKQLDRHYYWQFMGFLIPGLIWTTFWVIWVSDVFCRMVDEPSVRIARKMSLLMEKK